MRLAKLMIGWCLANLAIISAIVGAFRAEQLEDTLNASNFDFGHDLKDKLDKPTRVKRNSRNSA